MVQYGSDETKTHRKIKHILGSKYHGKVGRLLVSELFTVGQGGWSGFPPHKHDTDRLPLETRHDETYNFRFRPNHGFGLQLVQREDGKVGDAYHLIDSSTIILEQGYPPLCRAPGYEMYYFTILAASASGRWCSSSSRPRLSDRNHPRDQRHDRQVQMTAATLSEVLKPAMARATPSQGSWCSAGKMRSLSTEAAEEAGTPVILQAGPGCRKHTPVPILGKMFRHLAEQASVPVVCHIDHARTPAECQEGIEKRLHLGDDRRLASAACRKHRPHP